MVPGYRNRKKRWPRLTAARKKFLSLKSTPPEHKEVIKQKWASYLELPEEEKLRLKEAAREKARTTAALAKPGATPIATMPRPLSQPLSQQAKTAPPPLAQPLTHPIIIQAGK